MNYYIDFDNTLYDTAVLSKDMCHFIALKISQETDKLLEECKKEVESNFNREHIYNIYKLAKFFCKKYSLSYKEFKKGINEIILDGSKYVFSDSIKFLEDLKQKGHTIYLLTYVTKESLPYQLLKLNGSGIAGYVDDIIVSSTYKYKLDLDYENGIFIDDNPKDLLGLYSKNPIKVIRIKRPENKYSVKEININIDEYTSLEEIKL